MDAKLIYFKKIEDKRGSLTVAEFDRDLPFVVKRVYYISNVPEGEKRGFHSHKEIREICIAINGSCEIMVTNGKEVETFVMKDSSRGLYLGKDTWREISNFSKDAILLVLASEEFKEDDYIRDYSEFISSIKEAK